MAAGHKTGGRKKGSRNKKMAVMALELAASGEAPIDYMIRVMRDPSADEQRRDDMARAAAPYIHPRLAAVEHKGGTTIETVNVDLRLTVIDDLRKIFGDSLVEVEPTSQPKLIDGVVRESLDQGRRGRRRAPAPGAKVARKK